MTQTVIVLEPGKTDKHYWKDVFQYRDLFWVLARRDVSVRYKQTVIGILWAVLRPLLTMLASIKWSLTPFCLQAVKLDQ